MAALWAVWEALPTLKRTIEQWINRTIERAARAEKPLADARRGEKEKEKIYLLCVLVVKSSLAPLGRVPHVPRLKG